MRLFQYISAGFAVLAALAVALAAVSSSQIGVVNGLDSRQDKCGTNGVVDGQCGEAFEQKDCTGSLVKLIKPDVLKEMLTSFSLTQCSQACNKVTDRSVTSLRVSGDGNVASTVTCYMYSDENCNAEYNRLVEYPVATENHS
ncbi:uncharacterized protein LY79DRAFT_686938 [Colletotrichum navitas]|uniref:Uncharacterized protein n=1 Tax=Colletotrichum navitas TaxID=681940 RepID=A0AAD8QBJ7_9PEZI|nr:uncharacterized protein LY79DRAFT_686938 [Colletotrichum navitas]KAK1598961.1 hypothetical protein LY79DRAFT_686938 [Colletotrichum navitas]